MIIEEISSKITIPADPGLRSTPKACDYFWGAAQFSQFFPVPVLRFLEGELVKIGKNWEKLGKTGKIGKNWENYPLGLTILGIFPNFS